MSDQITVTRRDADWLLGKLLTLSDSWCDDAGTRKARVSLIKDVYREVLDFPAAPGAPTRWPNGERIDA